MIYSGSFMYSQVLFLNFVQADELRRYAVFKVCEQCLEENSECQIFWRESHAAAQ